MWFPIQSSSEINQHEIVFHAELANSVEWKWWRLYPRLQPIGEGAVVSMVVCCALDTLLYRHVEARNDNLCGCFARFHRFVQPETVFGIGKVKPDRKSSKQIPHLSLSSAVNWIDWFSRAILMSWRNNEPRVKCSYESDTTTNKSQRWITNAITSWWNKKVLTPS